ncbi:Ser/Thr protein kinase [Mycobacterium lentiflavum]|uniref:non-specific serine/threonine protein kinase n=1 Tax=Mycobacterium lentiflavum TaxID=141349 RepID=A0A0E4GXR3_MYCLN|nr:serine/threonine-protein kinase PknH/PknJ [Mycobacterium lentiflavum]CQD13484.1 Ser/Thr protein kinase [Mycobacterium lentiflavum]
MSETRVGSRFGHYQLRRLLGRGGMGEVYEAYDSVKDRVVALKLVSEQVGSDDVFRRRMQREAQTAGRLAEPHIVPIHDYGEIDGQLFIDMRFIEGKDVGSVLRSGPLPPPRAVAIVEQIASALDAAHRAGVIHRDIKPENILLTEGDFAYLVDFGIAAAATDQRVTKTGAAVGSWNYMAPERFGSQDPTYRVDIYALACLLYECLTGATPFQTDSLSSLMAAHMMEPIPRPSQRNPAIPAAFDAVIARGMAKNPYDRYVTAGDLAQAALHALSTPDQDRATDLIHHSRHFAPPPQPWTQPAPVPPAWVTTSPPWTPPPPPKRRLGLMIGAIAVVVAAVAGTGIWAAVRQSGASQPDTPTGAPATSSTPSRGAAPTVTPAQLNSMLASPDLVNTLLSTTGIVVDHSTTDMTDPGPDNTLSDDRCLGALIGFQTKTYKSSGYTAMLAQLMENPQSNPGYVVVQGAVIFASANQAQAFVTAQAEQWRNCAGRTVTQVNKGTTSEWTFREISGNPPNIALQHTLANSPVVCQHVLSAVSNVVFDVNGCAPGLINQARQIANEMATKVPS